MAVEGKVWEFVKYQESKRYKMHEIIIPENSSSNCYDSVVYSLLKYFNFEYEAYNIKYFSTDYFCTTKNGIYRDTSINNNILKDIFGIDLQYISSENTHDLFDVICTLLSDIPVGICIDSYYCHWSPFYNKAHSPHLILIVDIDYSNKKYICFDVHFNTVGYVKVDFDIISEYSEYYMTYHLKESTSIKLDLMLNSVRNVVYNFDVHIDSKKTQIINYIINNDVKFLFSKNIITSSLLINLLWIFEDKRNFSIALRYIENKVKRNLFSSVYELLSVSEKNFMLLKSILLKYAISGVLREEKLCDIVNQIFDIDALTVEKLRSVLKEI